MLWDLSRAVVGFLAAPAFLLLLPLYAALRPREGLLPVLAVLCFGLLALALPLRLVNFTSVMPLVLVGGLRGASLGIHRFIPRRFARWVLGILVAGVLAGSLVPDRHELGESFFPGRLAGWLLRGDLQDTVDAALAPEHGDKPLVLGLSHPDLASYLLCAHQDHRAGTVECLDSAKEIAEQGVRAIHIGDREIHELQYWLAGASDCPQGLEAVSARLDGPFLLLLDRLFIDRCAFNRCVDPSRALDCRRMSDNPEAVLWRCGDRR